MANARPDRPTSFEGGAAEGEEDDDSNVDKSSPKEESLTSNNKQNGVPHVRNVDRYGFMGGDQYTSPDEIPKVTLDIIRKREVKWVEMFENWEKWMTKRFKRVRARCRKGIPPSLRARAWQYLCGSKFLMDQNQGKFEEYLHKAGDPKWIDDIHKDLHRQFPLHEIFALRGGHGQEDLFRILKAYTIHNPQDGYCQAQGPIAAVLLMHMPAEQAFWCLVSICEKYLPGYYSPGLEAVHIDGDVLFGLLKKSSPVIYKHLKKQKIEPILYMTEWFMCVFSRTLPWTAVLRVWDMFFCEGVKVMFRIALVLFKLTLGTPEKLAECPTLYETMEKLRHIPHEIIDGEFIAKESLKLNVDEKDMEKEHQYQITKRRNLREKAQSSAKTETQSSKKKRKEKQLENEQKEKKHDYSHLTFRKLQNKLLAKETRIENVMMTSVSKPVEDEHILLPTSPVSKNESPSLKKSQTNMVSEMEMAKILAEEAFTAKMQQTVQPVSVEAEQFTPDTTRELPSETKSQQASQSVQLMAQTNSSDAQLPISITERPLLESAISFGENQLEESNMHLTDGNQLQQPGSLPEEGEKVQLHFVDTHTATVVQQMHSYHSNSKKAEINQIDLAVKLEPGQLLTLPTSKIQTRSQSPSSFEQLIQKPENEHPYSDKQLTCQFDPDIPRNYSYFITEAIPPAKSRSQSPTPSGHLILESVNDPIFLDKTQYLNHTATSLTGLQDVSESESFGGDLESLFVNPLSIEPDTVEQQQIQQFLADDIQNYTSQAKQQVECFDEQKPNKDLTAETISVIVKSQKVLHSKKIKPKHSLAVGQQTLSSRPLSTEIVKIKPQKLSSNLQMAASSISPEFAKISSIVEKKHPVPLLKQLAVECLLIKTQVPLQAAEAMSVRLKQLSLAASEVSSSEDKQPLYASDTIEKESLLLDEDPKATADNLVGGRRSEQIKESVEIKQTNVNEQLVQQLSWQTVQHSNEDATMMPVEAEASLPLDYDSTQMRETHI